MEPNLIAKFITRQYDYQNCMIEIVEDSGFKAEVYDVDGYCILSIKGNLGERNLLDMCVDYIDQHTQQGKVDNRTTI